MAEISDMRIQQADGFNPNDPKYKSCCCHSKTFTIVVGILEIFTICFILVAVLPDLNSRICESSYDDTSNNSSTNSSTPVIKDLRTVEFMHSLLCEINVYCLIWAVLQIITVNVMFYGIKSIRYSFFVPHLVFRFACTIVLVLIASWLIYIVTGGVEDAGTYITVVIFLAILVLFCLYSTWIEIRCAHFIKRSSDTGFSISQARPIGPATISLSEREPQQQIAIRQLPPLRHTRNQYVVNENKLDD